MNLEKWVDGYKVHVTDWIDGKNIYINIQYFKPGSSLYQPPAMEKTAYITNNDKGKNMVQNFLSTLVNFIVRSNVPADNKMVITVEQEEQENDSGTGNEL